MLKSKNLWSRGGSGGLPPPDRGVLASPKIRDSKNKSPEQGGVGGVAAPRRGPGIPYPKNIRSCPTPFKKSSRINLPHPFREPVASNTKKNQTKSPERKGSEGRQPPRRVLATRSKLHSPVLLPQTGSTRPLEGSHVQPLTIRRQHKARISLKSPSNNSGNH